MTLINRLFVYQITAHAFNMTDGESVSYGIAVIQPALLDFPHSFVQYS